VKVLGCSSHWLQDEGLVMAKIDGKSIYAQTLGSRAGGGYGNKLGTGKDNTLFVNCLTKGQVEHHEPSLSYS
jgi:hypothetical protein